MTVVQQKETMKGLKIKRFYTDGRDVFSYFKWERRTSQIKDLSGNVIFEMKDVEVPSFWSQVATDILAQKYFRKTGVPQYDENGNPILDKDGKQVTGSERSLRQVVRRLAGCWRAWGEKFKYFASPEDAQAFQDEIEYMLIAQMAAPNSPQWFNTGLHHAYGITGPPQGHYYYDEESQAVVPSKDAYSRPQAHACFILSIKDDLVNPGGIMDTWVKQARIYKYGSGEGCNYSSLRAKGEPLSGGGVSSGVMSFLRVGDTVAGSIKSGGTTRRAAKMVVLNIDHPEIEDFIDWKMKEEMKVAALVSAGYPADFEGEAYQTVSGQNSNNSVRVTNDFMRAVIEDRDWALTWRTNGRVAKRVKARDLWERIARAAWSCADPGMQFDTTINEWNTCPETGRINATNPCSEFNFLDNTACNLASLNLVKFYDEEKGEFDVKAFQHAVRLWTIVLEITVGMAQYPSPEIAEMSYRTRSLGLGYANLGGLLMRMGFPYDSDVGRAVAAAITALMTAEVYATSAEIAMFAGPFAEYEKNKTHVLRVLNNHRRAIYGARPEEYEGLEIKPHLPPLDLAPSYLLEAARSAWDRAVALCEKYGVRNAQATLIAPTGTIGLLMDCDTLGIEPDFSLVKMKKLVGGGYFKLVNRSLEPALRKLGYSEKQIRDIIEYVIGTNTLRGTQPVNYHSLKARGLKDDELQKIETLLVSASRLSDVLNPHVLGEETMRRLGIPAKAYKDPGFSLLKHLGFSDRDIEISDDVICGSMTVEGAPYLRPEHVAVFDCAVPSGRKGKRFVHYRAHLLMMAAVQPFLSGAISKTVNMPNEATVEDVASVYMDAWKLGLKCIAIYRDGSKLSQPLSTVTKKKEEQPGKPVRRRLPAERQAITHKFRVGEQEGYITVGLYEDGSPGEVFIKMAKEGSTLAGLMDAFSIVTSIALQYGVPLRVLVEKFIHTRFEPSGFTDNPQIRFAKSVVDYVFQWLALKFLPEKELEELGLTSTDQTFAKMIPETHVLVSAAPAPDAPPCRECGSIMARSGTCYVCVNCGATTGCS
ncbi:MAG: adenosylcobalamin-dependent ribonucleoside-diphosphate reductase [Candidatus Caldarchaeum sp.]|nr:adenosylcobalamin-dependent ribonucleoside-diphosphate reductase [Candidatus Caldarchaeum sp.]MDW8434898.1 adenosylcobalamin-dependent ribonucleoside-diphosphate reductase [Candidatus Caldarchaeum sp.]